MAKKKKENEQREYKTDPRKYSRDIVETFRENFPDKQMGSMNFDQIYVNTKYLFQENSQK